VITLKNAVWALDDGSNSTLFTRLHFHEVYSGQGHGDVRLSLNQKALGITKDNEDFSTTWIDAVFQPLDNSGFLVFNVDRGDGWDLIVTLNSPNNSSVRTSGGKHDYTLALTRDALDIAQREWEARGGFREG
jgi:hypothetical protein